MYVADHGQTLYDGACRLAFHGHNTSTNSTCRPLPGIRTSYGARFRTRSRSCARTAKRARRPRTCSIRCSTWADIRYPGDHLDRSFVSTQLASAQALRRQLWLDQLRQRHASRGDCREVIDKGKPLPRK
jgi:hypothetical protein